MEKRKVCSTCGEDKPWSEYWIIASGIPKSKCKTCCKEYNRDYYHSCKTYRRRKIKSAALWKKENRLRSNSLKNAYARKSSKELADYYIRGMLARNSNLSEGDIPQGLIEIKRQQLMIRRYLEERP